MSLPLSPTIRIAASFTAEPLKPVLESWLRALGFSQEVSFAPFNQVLQQLLDPGSLLSTNEGGVNVVLVRPVDFGADHPSRARGVVRELAAALGEAAGRGGSRMLAMVCPSAGGVETEKAFVADLKAELELVKGVELLDAERMAEWYPVQERFDAEAEQAARVPYTAEMFAAMATMLARKIAAVGRKPVKVIAVDCDHTLWGGVCGEVGPRGVVIDEGRRALQRFLMEKREEGYLLCLATKNNVADVEAVFRENPEMLLTRDAFVDAAVDWQPKSANLRRLAERLNLGLDGFVFLDDNPAEIAEVAQGAPAVLGIRVPEESGELPEFVKHLWVLDGGGRSGDDAKRSDFYRTELRRQDLKERTASYEEFLKSLELELEVRPLTAEGMARASQLTLRTNQFNANPRPRDEKALEEACRGMRAELVSVKDRFGDCGTVGLMLSREDGGRLWVETFLLSCRALGKGVEQRMLRHLGERAKALRLTEVAVGFLDSGRNQPCREFLERIDGAVWEDGLRVMPAEVAADLSLLPAAAAVAAKPGEALAPTASPELASRIAHELRDAAAIVKWVEGAVKPRPDLGEAFVRPREGAEEKIASIWRGLLRLEEVGRNDRFVDLGGSSLDLVRVHAEMQRGFGRRFPLVSLFEKPTVALQAELMEGAGETTMSTVGERREDGSGALAIIGMAVRLPGASTPEELWGNLKNGTELVKRFDRSELEVPAGEGDPNFVCARGLLDPEVFEGLDGGLFGIVPREAEIIDPQHRVFLEICWEALERGGYVPDAADADGNRVGVYAGCYYDTYLPHHILSDPATHRRHLEEAQVGALQVEFGNDKDHLATRVAFKLNLKGPSLSVQTACSTSLVAVAHAAMALRTGQCDMALAGGVTVTVPQKRGYRHEQGGMLSRDGRCRPFDEESSGTVFSNGAGVVLLKRLEDAVRDGDHIHAVLRGFGMNNDGGVKHSYAAPSVEGQADAILRAHRDAGVDPRTISYVEAHGTATPLGDPIEVAGLTRAFRHGTEDKGFCALGSLKSNLGHLDTAAGVCGLIKTVLSLEHGELPAVLHFKKANPRIDFANSPFFVNDRHRPWTPAEGVPRRAGVSSFGVGGTNVHLIVEEAPGVAVEELPAVDRLLVFSGRDETALEQVAERLAGYADRAAEADFAAAARTLALGRKAMTRRAAVVARDWKSAAEALRSRRWAKAAAAGVEPELVWMFPGQGAQYPGMTADLYAAERGYREDIDRCAELLLPELGEDLRETLFAKDGEAAAERLKRTVLAQPSIFVVEYALARQWQRWGLAPELMLGHSVGEFAAACLAGVFSLEDGLRILAARGRLMDGLPGGSMLSVRLAADELRGRLPADLDLAAENGPELCVVAGECEAVAAFARGLEADGVNVRELHTSHAFHSRMMDPVVDRFREVLETVKLKAPEVPILSTVTGRLLTEAEAADAGYWAAHLRRTVLFHGALEAAAEAKEGRIYLEVGPGQTLTTLARQTAGRRAAACLPTCEHPASGAPDRVRMLQTLGELWCRNAAVDWEAVHADAPARRVPLPTYPFQRKRHWLPCRLLDLPAVVPSCERTEPEEAPAVEPETAAVESGDRPTALMAKARQVLEDLSGIPGEEMTEDAGFLELGFDSLLLTQAARELQKAFGIPVTFRDLMQAHPNLGALVAHVDATAPAREAPKKAEVKRVETTVVVSGPEEESGVSGPRTRIDRVSTAGDLTENQQKHLDALIRRYNAKTAKSKELTQQYRQWHADPRTVNGFNRLWKEMVYQVVATKMKGCRMWDVDGNEYIDMVNGFGPNFLGHSPDFVTRAIEEQLATGLEIGPQCEAAMETSKLFCEVTGNERVCFLNTGSEAVQAAMRIARTVTGRDKILVFDKDYHGNFDPVLVRSVGKGARRRTLPLAPGIPESAVGDVIVVPWGKPEALEMIREVADELAAVLVEPVQSRQPEWIPIEFVREVKKISEENGFLLVFDEVITGLRQGLGGAQALYGIRADLATYGKVFGGGALPIGIIGGKSKYMDTFDGGHWQYGDDSFPEKEVTFFAGTFVRLPLAMAACRAVLTYLKDKGPEYWDGIRGRADRLAGTVDRLFRDNGIDVRMVNFGSQMYLRIGDDTKHGNLIYYHLREKGVFAMEGLPFYLTAEHTEEDVDFVIRAFRETIAELQEGGFLPGPVLPLAEGTDVRGPFPMTEPMSEIWLGSLLGKDANLAFNEMLQLRLTGPVDPEVAAAAVQDLVDRHDALRMRLPDEHAEGFIIDPEQKAWIRMEDLREAPDAGAALAELGREQRETEFDLLAGPLFRVVVARLGEEEMVVQFAAHHLACDGWSFEVLMKDFAKLYEDRMAERRSVSPAPPSIVDRALREAKRTGGDEAALAWWVERFADGVPEVELPLKRPYGAAPEYQSATFELRLDAETMQRLRKLAGGCGATLNSTLLAGFQALLYKLSGQERFVMTFPMAGQMEGGDERLVGHCVNFLPLLAEVDSRRSFKELAGAVSTAQFDAIEHGKVTYGRLLRALKLGREGGRRPLMEVIFNFEPSADPGGFAGLEAKVETVAARYSNSTIFLNVMQSAEGLLFSSTYNRLLLDEETMRGWLEAYRRLLLDAAKDPSTAIEELELLDEEGLAELEAWSGGGFRPVEGSVTECFREICGTHADRAALSWKGGSWNYGELAGKASGVAAALRKAGVAPGDRVGVDLRRGPYLIASIFGILEAGACFVPVDPGYPVSRKERIFTAAGVKVVLGEKPAVEGVVAIDPTGVERAEFAPAPRKADDPAYVLFTSGSTGEPKGALVPQRGILRLVKDCDYCELGPDEVLLQGSTVAFDAATFEIFGALLNGGRLVLLEEKASLAEMARTIRDEKVTTVWLTAGLFELMMEEHAEDLRSVRQLLAGGDVLSPPHVKKALEALPETRLINGYGPTENTTFTTCHTIRREDVEGGSIPIGRPIRGTTVYLLDGAGKRVLPGVAGELHCGGDGLALGYLGRPELTEEMFVPNPLPGHEGETLYRTGDLCRWRTDGTIEFIGRRDGQVKVRGFRIELPEIENVLSRHPAVRRCKAGVRGGGAGGKRLLAWFVPEQEAATEVELRRWLEERLPAFMLPERILEVESMPLNANGKVDVAALPEASAAVENDAEAPEGEMETKLAELWQELLGTGIPGRDDDFFDIGGNSLAGLRMFARIRRDFGVSLPLSTLLRAKTIRTLAAVIGTADAAEELASPDHLALVQPDGDLTPVFAVHGGDGGILFYRELADRLPKDRPFFAIESPNLGRSGEIEIEPIETTAAKYVEMIRGVRPRGPYLLAGYSYGGLMAFEMARQLLEAGEEVPYLALIDTINPAAPMREYSMKERVSVYWNAQGDQPLLGKIKTLAGRFREGIETNLRVKAEAAEAAEAAPAEAHSELRAIQLREAHYRAMRQYVPGRFEGRMTLFRATGVNDKFEVPDDYGWNDRTALLEVVDVPGEHLTMFHAGNVGPLAEEFERRLPRMEAESSGCTAGEVGAGFARP